MKTVYEIIAEGERKLALATIRAAKAMIYNNPLGWNHTQWKGMLQKIADQSKLSGLTDEEIEAAGLPKAR